MKSKLLISALLVSLFTISVMAAGAYAFDHGKKGGEKWGLEEKFSKKAHMILDNQKELGLSAEQVDKVKELKLKTKKDLVKMDADIEMTAIDMKAEMGKEPMDKDAVNKLIDKKYDLKKEKAKYIVAACASLKGILTKEQADKMKELWKKCEKGKMRCPMMEKGMMKHGMKGEEKE